ncbi:hypothetical protein GTA08_BOTSDO02139 [Neofusicoccum parvum]|uniref:Uncharacterized protein n=1 Tax=Neofusicoccum parvum TaxID=310453 RepID=A0ACB5S6D7_9PEZI|nr:hypothetical protein GTA08_BOTSDO02139 [Neofusicoccum parvum]GME65425.1 hypothetical protein GTA08_BOTSDO02139 [Neofusicoccum parvum]
MARRSSTVLLAVLCLCLFFFFSASPGQSLHRRRALKTCLLEPELQQRAQRAKVPTHTDNQTLRHLFGLPSLLDSYDHCYNASTRLAPYGFDPHEQKTDGQSIWARRDWKKEQHECAVRNGLLPSQAEPRKRFHLPDKPPQRYLTTQPAKKDVKKPAPRTAVVMRTSDNFNWAGDVTAYIRSMIVELALESGGQYELFILVQVKDLKQRIFLDPEAYNRVLRKHVPEEFRGMAYLWNENMLKEWYPEVPNHSYIHQAYQALELFAQVVAPDFDYFWQFEMDWRATAPHLQAFERMAAWAREQPRLYLTNMNSAWYIPSLQGSWHDLWMLMNETLWNDKRAAEVREHGKNWGVGEEADLITLAPIVDVRTTDFWLFRGMVHNDPLQIKAKKLPHFAAPVAMTRTSKRLLDAVHKLQQEYGFWMASEATMETMAFHHKFKAVHVQHPVYFNGTENDKMIDWLFNSGGPENLGGGPDSQYNWEGAAHKTLEKLTWWWPREGYDHYPQHVWTDFLRKDACLPPGMFHPFKWEKFSSPK